MKKILFVCSSNTSCALMTELIFKDIINKKNLNYLF